MTTIATTQTTRARFTPIAGESIRVNQANNAAQFNVALPLGLPHADVATLQRFDHYRNASAWLTAAPVPASEGTMRLFLDPRVQCFAVPFDGVLLTGKPAADVRALKAFAERIRAWEAAGEPMVRR